MTAPARSWWVDGTRAFYLYRAATGDFTATIHVNVTGVATPMPQRDWSLSGLLLRSPASTKTDENRVSLRVGAVGGGWVDLRVARVGSLFVLLTRRPKRAGSCSGATRARICAGRSRSASTRSATARTAAPTSSPTWTPSTRRR
jgi:hypothetical protein